MNKNVKRNFLIFLGFLLLCLVLYRPAVKNLIFLELNHGWASDLPRGFTNGNGAVKDLMPDGWQVNNWDYSNQQQGLISTPEHGNVLFMLKTNAGGAASVSQAVDIQGPAAAQVKIRYQGGPAVIIFNQIKDGEDQLTSLRMELPEVATWNEAVFDVSLNAKTKKAALILATYAKEKPILFDHVSFAREGGENLLTNPSFEEDGGAAELLQSPLWKRQESTFSWAIDILKDDRPALLQMQAMQYYLAGDLVNLRSTLTDLGSQSDQAETDLGWLSAEGIRQYQQKQYLASYETFQLVLVAEPDSEIALSYLAFIYNELGAYDLAFSTFEKVPLSLSVAFPAGMIALDQKGYLEKAHYYFEFLRSVSPAYYVQVNNRLTARLEYAQSLVQAGDCDLAKEQFKVVAAVASAGTDLLRQAVLNKQELKCP